VYRRRPTQLPAHLEGRFLTSAVLDEAPAPITLLQN
jgi:hypothetical protein